MAEVEERRCGDEDYLEDPEPNVRDGEGVVVADVLTTRLFGVTNHFGLFIAPNLTRSQNHDPEQEQDAHPDLPNHQESPDIFGLKYQ
uniref:Uncharacterized protein n=1 Tax=Nothobranchius furzeri TaxID=105023 RepID=A0A8C6KFM7_NOTFU